MSGKKSDTIHFQGKVRETWVPGLSACGIAPLPMASLTGTVLAVTCRRCKGTEALKWAKPWERCGNCPDGGQHQPQFHEGDIVILQNAPERGQVVVVGKETFPHYFEVMGRRGTYCETCFQRPTA